MNSPPMLDPMLVVGLGPVRWGLTDWALDFDFGPWPSQRWLSPSQARRHLGERPVDGRHWPVQAQGHRRHGDHAPRLKFGKTWGWVKLNHQSDRFWSLVPFTKVPIWVLIFEQPHGNNAGWSDKDARENGKIRETETHWPQHRSGRQVLGIAAVTCEEASILEICTKPAKNRAMRYPKAAQFSKSLCPPLPPPPLLDALHGVLQQMGRLEDGAGEEPLQAEAVGLSLPVPANQERCPAQTKPPDIANETNENTSLLRMWPLLQLPLSSSPVK